VHAEETVNICEQKPLHFVTESWFLKLNFEGLCISRLFLRQAAASGSKQQQAAASSSKQQQAAASSSSKQQPPALPPPRSRHPQPQPSPKRAAAAATRQLAAFRRAHVQRIAQLKMSLNGRASGGAVKRKRGQQVEEVAPAPMQVAAHPKLLMLLAVVKSSQDTLVLLRLCDVQGAALFSFVQAPPHVPRPFAGAPVYDMSLTHAERLCAVGCGLKGRLVRVLSLGVGRHFEPQRNWRACHQMMQSISRRVAAGLVAAVRDEVANEAEELCASGQCAAAVVPLQLAIDFGDSNSRALKAWLLIGGREGVAKDVGRGFELAEQGARLGCHHCQGVMAYCYCHGYGCERDLVRSLELARESSGRGSRFGQFTLGAFHLMGRGGLAQDDAQAVAFFRLAAAQGLDGAQCSLGCMYYCGLGVFQDLAEALRLYQLAAAQGHPSALWNVATCYEDGRGVRKSKAAAIRWYRRAQAAGHPEAADDLKRLRA